MTVTLARRGTESGLQAISINLRFGARKGPGLIVTTKIDPLMHGLIRG